MMGTVRAGAMGSAMVGLLGLLAARSMAYSAAPVVGGGSVTGTIRYAGPVPSRGVLEVTKDQAVCGSTAKLANNLVVAPSGGLQYAVVSLRGVAVGKPFDGAPATLDQRGCEYTPHVVIVPAGKDCRSSTPTESCTTSIRPACVRCAANPPVNRRSRSSRRR
jgi:hypothetical protein